jgi:general L-amino acid transport system permease protein
MSVQPEMLKPPRTEVGLLGWLKKNLFGTWYNVLLTIVSGVFIFFVLRAVITWVVSQARWAVITTNLRLFFIGRYPKEEGWRVIAAFGLILVLSVLSWLARRREGNRLWGRLVMLSWFLAFPVIYFLLRGFLESGFLPLVKPIEWGGLLLTLVLSIVGIVASFPLGVILALGRRSQLPVIRVLCTTYIETVRGVPLISVLFMSQTMLPLFLPDTWDFSTVLRALTGITLFSAAYTAENVRGGLAAIPVGQYEAARAVGLNEVYVMGLIVLPQALRAVIPAIVGQFIALFKDTTLVAIVGLQDLLGIGKSVTAQKEFIGLHREAYAFVGVLFFVCCYAMSYASRRLEKALGVGER